MEGYVSRLVDGLLEEYLAELPAVMVVGPRACGKTTTAVRLAQNVVRLDSADAAAFRASPDAALRDRPEPVLLDEWQMVPEVLAAVKRAVDTDRRPGRFVPRRSLLDHINNIARIHVVGVVHVGWYPPVNFRYRRRSSVNVSVQRMLVEDAPQQRNKPVGRIGICGTRVDKNRIQVIFISVIVGDVSVVVIVVVAMRLIDGRGRPGILIVDVIVIVGVTVDYDTAVVVGHIQIINSCLTRSIRLTCTKRKPSGVIGNNLSLNPPFGGVGGVV